MMVFLPFDTWIRLVVWMLIGLDVYLGYGMKKSLLNAGNFDAKSYKTVGWCGICLSALLVIVAFGHHYTATIPDNALFYFSLAFAVLHLIIFGTKLMSKGKQAV
jgi:APA family basic amino acid/polyamine antiporter